MANSPTLAQLEDALVMADRDGNERDAQIIAGMIRAFPPTEEAPRPQRSWGEALSTPMEVERPVPFSVRPNLIPVPTKEYGWIAPKWLEAMSLPGRAAKGESYDIEEIGALAGFGMGVSPVKPIAVPTSMSRTLWSRVPSTEARTKALAHKQLAELAGGDDNLAALYATAIKNRQSQIPGYTRNLGQVVGEAPESTSVLAAMEESARKPGLAVQTETARDANIAAIAKARQAVGGGTADELLAQEALVAANAERNYALGREAPIGGSHALDYALRTPSGQQAIDTAVRAAQDAHRLSRIPAEAGTGLPAEFTGKALEDILKSIGEQRAHLVAQGKTVGVDDLTVLENRLTEAIKDVNPAVVEARLHYQGDKTPANQMRLIQHYQQALDRSGASAVTGPEAEARLVQGATGGRYKTFDKVLSPEQMTFLNRMTEETRLAEVGTERAGRTGGIPTERSPLERAAHASMSQYAPTVALKRGIEMAGGWRNKAVTKALLDQYLHPEKFVSPLTPSIPSRVGQALRLSPQAPYYGFSAVKPYVEPAYVNPPGYD